MKSTTKETISVILVFILCLLFIFVGAFVTYVKFMAYWRIAFGN